MSLIVIASDRFEEHQTPPGHPESPARARAMQAVATRWRGRGPVAEPTPATDAQLARVHDPDYLHVVSSVAGRSVSLDPDTFTSPESIEVARLAAGAAAGAVERVLATKGLRALALVRPPGHHAERDRAMGFCFYNNVAVAAAEARARGVERVAIVDYDVHHGNGTEHMFAADPHVLYVSTHQYPYYPGTGAATDVGSGAGAGFTVNVPLEAGATDGDYEQAFREVVVPVLTQFAPNLIIVSAGFDAHQSDPLAGMRLTTGAFAAMTSMLTTAADTLCDGRIVAVTEGGYDLRALEGSMQAVVDVFAAPAVHADWPRSPVESSRGRAAVDLTKRAHGGFWKLTK